MAVKARTYSRYTREAGVLLGKLVRLGRKERRWTEHELAGRAGISRATLQKVEKGDPTVAIGLVFEVAVLVGVPLFGGVGSSNSLAAHIARVEGKLSLLPASVREPRQQAPDDDF